MRKSILVLAACVIAIFTSINTPKANAQLGDGSPLARFLNDLGGRTANLESHTDDLEKRVRDLESQLRDLRRRLDDVERR
jgi:peptidoglycan hydrolase CwlO-like protein